MKLNLKIIILAMVLILGVQADLTLPCQPTRLTARRVRQAGAKSQWLNLAKSERYSIMERIAVRFPRINIDALKKLDELITAGKFEGDISPLTIEQAMEYIAQFDELNAKLFGSEFKTLKIELEFMPFVPHEYLDGVMRPDEQHMRILVPTKTKFTTRWFIREMFSIYLHEDGHIKAEVVINSSGKLSILSVKDKHWFGAVAQGELSSPFLRMSGYQKDFRDYLKKGKILRNAEDSMLNQIAEVLNDKLLSLVHGNRYREYSVGFRYRIYQENTQGPEGFNRVYDSLHGPEKLDIRIGASLLVNILKSNLKTKMFSAIPGAPELSQNFRVLAEKIIDKMDISWIDRFYFKREYNHLVDDFLNLAKALSLTPSLEEKLSKHSDELNSLWDSLPK